MKLRALCDAQLSAKSTITNLLCSAKSHKNSKGLEDGSMPGACSTGGSKAEIPGLQKHTDTAKGPDNQAMAEEPKAVTDFMQNSTFSSVKNSTPASAPPRAAESQAAAQKQQIPAFAKTCSKTESSAVTKALQNPGMDLAMVLEQHLGALGKLKRTRSCWKADGLCLHKVSVPTRCSYRSPTLPASIQCPSHINKQEMQEGCDHRDLYIWSIFSINFFFFPQMGGEGVLLGILLLVVVVCVMICWVSK